MEAHVGLAVGREVLEHRVDRDRRARSSASSDSRRGPLGGEHRDPDLDRDPLVAGVAPGARAAPRGGGGAGGSGSATNVPPPPPAGGVQVPALAERDQRLAQRRARDPEASRTARARPAAACRAAAGRAGSRSRAARPSPRMRSCERTGANTVVERGGVLQRGARARGRVAPAGRSQPLEAPDALPVGDGRLERGQLDVGRVEVVVDDLIAERRRAPARWRRTGRARRAASLGSRGLSVAR